MCRRRSTSTCNDGDGSAWARCVSASIRPIVVPCSPRPPATASNTSVCLKIVDPAITSLSVDAQWAFVKDLVALIEKEGAAYDIATHRDAPPGLRIWCGCTVETSDVQKLTPWIDWAFAKARDTLPKAA